MSASRTAQHTNRRAYYFLGRSAMRWQTALDTRSTSRRRDGAHEAKSQ